MTDAEKYQDVCRLTDVALAIRPVQEFMDGGNMPLTEEHQIVMHLLNSLSALRQIYRRDQ